MPRSINTSHIMKDVYSYPYPEVREHLERIDKLAPRFMLNTLDHEEVDSLLTPYEFQPPLEPTVRDDGSLDLDELHIPVIERIRNVHACHMSGIESFENAYPMAGSSQSMFQLMAEWHANGKMTSLAVLEGEYDGYSAYAESLGIPVKTYKNLKDAEKTDGEVWFVSNPSARDGNWIEDKQWGDFLDTGSDVVLDAAYVGLTTDDKKLDVSRENIKAVLTSPSKLFGVFRYRMTGVTYTREPVKSMYGSKWFKDIPALLASLSLYETFGLGELPKQYKETQQEICDRLSETIGATVLPSNVLLLAYTEGKPDNDYEHLKRYDVYRFGLAKLMEDMEMEEVK